MMELKLRLYSGKIKAFFLFGGLLLCASCAVNPATGKRQFAAFMSPQEEIKVGAQEHDKIASQYGLYDKDPALLAYVRSVGAKVAKNTERPDVEYQFFIIDSPIVNAFALPGGYVYISRGLLALANNEAQLASVLGHEIGHITARHSAERYSHGVVTQLGVSLLSAIAQQPGVGDALGLGANLYLSAYSRDQEREADHLGVRYMASAGYQPTEAPEFLTALHAHSNLEKEIAGEKGEGVAANYFATHPLTTERIEKTAQDAGGYRGNYVQRRDAYLDEIDGLAYGDSADQGVLRGLDFYHAPLGFKFKLSRDGLSLFNQPENIVVKDDESEGLLIFDMARTVHDPEKYMRDIWLKDRQNIKISTEKINAMAAATTNLEAKLNGRAVGLYMYALRWSDEHVARFQIAMPRGAKDTAREDLVKVVQGFRKMEKRDYARAKPNMVSVVAAKSSDDIEKLSKKMPFRSHKRERFEVLNHITRGQDIHTGERYKIVVSP